MRADWLDVLATRFASSYPETCTWRTIGREAEMPVVHEDGTAADVQPLLEALAATGDFRVERAGDAVAQLDGDRYSYGSEVGRGTVEVITAPCDDLHEIRAIHEEAVGRLVALADERGLKVLGYGIQPVTPASLDFMMPKVRYRALYDSIGDLWLWFTLTASDQIHVAIARDEIVPMNNITNLLAAVTVALCGNSPIFAGEPSGHCSAREGRMGEIGASQGRHGMPLGPVTDLQGYMAQVCSHPMVLRWDGELRVAESRAIEEVLVEAGGPQTDEGWRQFLLHDHYIWNTGRPRHRQATIELRAACQQPQGEHMAGAALHVGMVCAGEDLASWLSEQLGSDPWPVLRAYHHEVVRIGLAAEEPFEGFLTGVLDRCRDALAARGRGEEVYLEPLYHRVHRGVNPAQVALEAYDRGGISELLGLVAYS